MFPTVLEPLKKSLVINDSRARSNKGVNELQITVNSGVGRIGYSAVMSSSNSLSSTSSCGVAISWVSSCGMVCPCRVCG